MYKLELLNISKESFGFITLDMLNEYNKELKSIYKTITTDNKLNMTYNHKLINNHYIFQLCHQPMKQFVNQTLLH